MVIPIILCLDLAIAHEMGLWTGKCIFLYLSRYTGLLHLDVFAFTLFLLSVYVSCNLIYKCVIYIIMVTLVPYILINLCVLFLCFNLQVIYE